MGKANKAKMPPTYHTLAPKESKAPENSAHEITDQEASRPKSPCLLVPAKAVKSFKLPPPWGFPNSLKNAVTLYDAQSANAARKELSGSHEYTRQELDEAKAAFFEFGRMLDDKHEEGARDRGKSKKKAMTDASSSSMAPTFENVLHNVWETFEAKLSLWGQSSSKTKTKTNMLLTSSVADLVSEAYEGTLIGRLHLMTVQHYVGYNKKSDDVDMPDAKTGTRADTDEEMTDACQVTEEGNEDQDGEWEWDEY